MNKIKTAGLAAVFALTASVASAAVVFDVPSGTVASGAGSVNQTSLANGGGSIDFSWNSSSPEYFAYSTFTVDSDFKLEFLTYTPPSDEIGGVGASSGFQLYAGSYGSLGSPELGSDSCGAFSSIAGSTTQCVRITGNKNVGSTFVQPPETYGMFSAGTYTLAFSEGNHPVSGSAGFEISAVPVPAAGFLLIGALGGLAAMRRRKTA